MATKMKPSDVKRKLKSRLETLAKLQDRILNDASAALEEMQDQLPTVGAPVLGYDDPVEPIEDALDELRDAVSRLETLAEKMGEVMIEQADVEEQLEQLDAAKVAPTAKADDGDTLNRIALALKGAWDADVFSEIAAMVRSTGRKV